MANEIVIKEENRLDVFTNQTERLDLTFALNKQTKQKPDKPKKQSRQSCWADKRCTWEPVRTRIITKPEQSEE